MTNKYSGSKSGFLLALVAGTACIVATSLGKVPLLFPSAALLLIMTGYAVWAYRQCRRGADMDSAADSLYYMGFLFTLISLTVSTVQMNIGGQDRMWLTSMLECFGMALTSTIFGLVVRLVFFQSTIQQSTSSEEIEKELIAANHDLTYEITQSVENLRKIRDQTSDALSNTCSTVVDEIRHTAESACSAVRECSDATLRTIEERNRYATESSASSVERVFAELEGSCKRLFSSLSASVGEFHEELSSFESPGELISREIASVTKGVKGAFERLEHTIGEIRESLTKQLEVFNERISKHDAVFIDELDEMVEQFRTKLMAIDLPSNLIVEKIKGMIEEIQSGTRFLKEALVESAGHIDAQMTQVTTHLDNLNKEAVEEFRRTLSQLREKAISFDPPGDIISDKIGSFADTWGKMTEEIVGGLKRLKDILIEQTAVLSESLPDISSIRERNAVIKSVSIAGRELEKGMGDLSNRVMDTGSSFEILDKRLADSVGSIDGCVRNLRDMERSFDGSLNIVKKYSDDLREETEAAKNATVNVLDNLLQTVLFLKRVAASKK